MPLEVVILNEVMASYASTWLRIATTQGTETLKVGDVFRESGAGDGAEEMKVESFDISPIAGGSKMLVVRCHHVTKPQTYRLGAVLRRLESDPEPVAVKAPRPKQHRSDQGVNDLLADV